MKFLLFLVFLALIYCVIGAVIHGMNLDDKDPKTIITWLPDLLKEKDLL